MAVRYGKAVTKNVLERPMINNFNADIRESMEQQDQELAEKYVAFIRDLYEITDQQEFTLRSMINLSRLFINYKSF